MSDKLLEVRITIVVIKKKYGSLKVKRKLTNSKAPREPSESSSLGRVQGEGDDSQVDKAQH